MFTWFMHPNFPNWFFDPKENLADCMRGMLRSLARRQSLTGASLN